MTPIFSQHSGVMLPIDKSNVDTDALLPKQYLASIHKSGYGEWLFDDVRYLDEGSLTTDCSKRRINPDFVLNKSEFSGASIMLSRENFGCGSSREHAVWALRDYGIKIVIAQSFASIFFDNCAKNNILCIELDAEKLAQVFEQCNLLPGSSISVDLQEQTIVLADKKQLQFEISPTNKEKILYGLDDIAITLQQKETILDYEKQHKMKNPWLFNSFKSNA